jgi:hypothetical protein
MRKVEFDVFKYEELGEKAKKRAKEKYGDTFDYSDCVTSEFECVLQQYGYGDCKLEWSLGYCQGDGVAFYGKVDVEDWWRKRGRTLFSKEEKRKLLKYYKEDSDLSIAICRNSFGHHYSHYNTMYVEVTWGNKELLELLEGAVLEDIKDISKELARQGYKDLEHYYSEESFAETAEANEWEFFADGTLV